MQAQETSWRWIVILLYCTALHCTALHCTALYCTVLHCTVLYCTVPYCTVLYCTVLYCTVLYCTVLYCTALYCTVLYCTALYCTWCDVLYVMWCDVWVHVRTYLHSEDIFFCWVEKETLYEYIIFSILQYTYHIKYTFNFISFLWFLWQSGHWWRPSPSSSLAGTGFDSSPMKKQSPMLLLLYYRYLLFMRYVRA